MYGFDSLYMAKLGYNVYYEQNDRQFEAWSMKRTVSFHLDLMQSLTGDWSHLIWFVLQIDENS